MSLVQLFAGLAIITAGLILWRIGRSDRGRGMVERMALWLLFSVVLSTLPLCFDFVAMFKAAHGVAPAWAATYSKGELCLITTALSGVAIGELLAVRKSTRLWTILPGFLCLACALGSIYLYSLLHGETDPSSTPMIAYLSFWIYVLAVGASTASVAVAELEK